MSLPSNFLFFGATVKLKCSWYRQRVECFRLCVRVCVCLRVSLAEGCAPFCTFIVLQAHDHMTCPVCSCQCRQKSTDSALVLPSECCSTHFLPAAGYIFFLHLFFFIFIFISHHLRTMCYFFFYRSSSRRHREAVAGVSPPHCPPASGWN